MTLPAHNVTYTRRSQHLDSFRRYLTDSPTPERFAAILRSTDGGDVAAAIELQEEMEAKDAHLQGVANTRRLALTALPWDVIPDPNAKDQAAAELAAEFVSETLRKVQGWEAGLDHLATAIGPGVAAMELIWNRGKLVEVIPVPGDRLEGDVIDGSGVFMLTDDHLTEGIRISGHKFVLFTPSVRGGFHPLRVTITRAQAYLWIIKHYTIADWAAFNETYGQPVRMAKFKQAATEEEQTTVRNMLENMGSDLWGMFTDQVDVEFLETARNAQPYGDMVEWIERKQSILFLGQTLTTEPNQIGSLALGAVHDSVRAALTLSDIKNEAIAIQKQVFRWVVRFQFPGRDMPLPLFHRQPAESRNLDADRVELEKLRYLREAGLPVDPEVVYERLGVPPPKTRESSQQRSLETV
jgi:phage gp29-like protein